MRKTPLYADTTPEAEEILVRIYREMPAWRKIELVEEANRCARQLAMAGLRLRHPNEDVATLHRRLLGLLLGEETATCIYGPMKACE